MATFGNLETTIPFLVELMDEHEVVQGLAQRAIEAIDEAMDGTAEARDTALEVLRDLDAYLLEDLPLHIAKEEDVLFPALRGFAADLDKVVVEMVEQHDEVRFRSAAIEAAMRKLDADHERVENAKAGFSETLRHANGPLSDDDLATLLDAVKRLDWILQGHFGDEEDDLFVPAIDLLTPETWATLHEQARQLSRS